MDGSHAVSRGVGVEGVGRVDGGVGTVQATEPAHRRSWLRLRRAPEPSSHPEETLRNVLPKDDAYSRSLSVCRWQTGRPLPTR